MRAIDIYKNSSNLNLVGQHLFYGSHIMAETKRETVIEQALHLLKNELERVQEKAAIALPPRRILLEHLGKKLQEAILLLHEGRITPSVIELMKSRSETYFNLAGALQVVQDSLHLALARLDYYQKQANQFYYLAADMKPFLS